MRPTAIAAIAAIALVAVIIAPAQAGVGPSQAGTLKLVLTKAEMIKAAGYSGTLGDYDPPERNCEEAPEFEMTECRHYVYSTAEANTAPYPYYTFIYSFRSTAALGKFWTENELNPIPVYGETITIVSKSQKSITWYAIPSGSDRMPWAYTVHKGKRYIMGSGCAAATAKPNIKALTECSRKVAAAQVAKAQGR